MRRTLEEIEAGAQGGLLSFGVLAALWAGNGMASVMTALNAAYDVEDTRAWWKSRLVSILLTFGFALFSLAWNVLNLPVVIFFVLLGIALVYYFAPAAKQHWRWVTPGSVVALVLWLAMSYGLRFYVARFADYGATYGSIGGVILLMLWLYLTGVVLLVGAEINAEIEHAAAARGAITAKAPGEQAAPVDAVAEPAPAVDDDFAVAGRPSSAGSSRRGAGIGRPWRCWEPGSRWAGSSGDGRRPSWHRPAAAWPAPRCRWPARSLPSSGSGGPAPTRRRASRRSSGGLLAMGGQAVRCRSVGRVLRAAIRPSSARSKTHGSIGLRRVSCAPAARASASASRQIVPASPDMATMTTAGNSARKSRMVVTPSLRGM